jgi:hypothetical protein
VIVAVAVTFTVGLLVTVHEWLVAVAILAVGAIVGAIALAIRTSRVRMLTEGAAAVGTIEKLEEELRQPAFRIRYETPSGPVSALCTSTIGTRLAGQVGGWPQLGDTVFLVYDPRVVTRNEVWSLARGPAHDDAAAQRLLRRRAIRGSLLIGAFFVLTCGVPTIAWYLRDVPAGRIASCDGSHSHMDYYHLVLGDGRRHTVTSNDVADLEACPPPGTTIEKRRGEFGYRIDGVVRPVNGGSIVGPGLLAVVGCGALLFAAVAFIRSRQRE